MKTEYIILLLLLAIVLLVVVNKKQENAIFCKLPNALPLIPDASGNYDTSFCCSGKIDAEHKCTCLASGENFKDYVTATVNDCCSKNADASNKCN
jgi:hypothetical protein